MIVAIKAAYFNLLGSLRCHNRNDNENVQKAISLISEKKLHLNHALCYISLPSPNNYDQKLPNFNYIFHGLTYFTGIQLQEGCPLHFKKRASWKNNFKEREFIFPSDVTATITVVVS